MQELSPRTQKDHQEIWHDIDHNKYYILKDGTSVEIDQQGNRIKKFVPHVTGESSYRARMETGLECVFPKLPQNSPVVSSITHLSGYTQFPRPVCGALYNEMKMPRPDKKKEKRIMEVLEKIPVQNIYNESPLKQKDYTVNGCTFLTDMPSKFNTLTSRNLEKSLEGSIEPSICLNNKIDEKRPSMDIKNAKSCEKLRNSDLKQKYLSSLKGTFHSFTNIKGVSEQTLALLKKDSHLIDDTPQPTVTPPPKTFQEFDALIRQQISDYQGFVKPAEKPPVLNPKGIYNVHIPSMGELRQKSLEWRKSLNPIAAKEEERRAELDHEILKKRKQQRMLKYNAMMSIIRAQEREIQKEIEAKKIALEIAEKEKEFWKVKDDVTEENEDQVKKKRDEIYENRKKIKEIIDKKRKMKSHSIDKDQLKGLRRGGFLSDALNLAVMLNK